jgi:predicted ATPase/DNA-binding winged helix-turn-helix (wHTH) protein
MNTSTTAGAICFGPFELYPERRQLLERGEPVRLGSRALDLLIALTERAGELVSRNELESRLWPRTIVEETSLRVQMSALRKALGDGTHGVRYITNVPGRGYSFVAPIHAHGQGMHIAVAPPLQAVAVLHNLPTRIDRIIGRETVSAALAAELRAGRMASLVGAGGMGKTTVALHVAKQCLPEFTDGVRFVDLAPLPVGSPVLPTLADALEIPDGVRDLWAAVEDRLRGRRMLLVLDNCEHVVQAAAELVERLMVVAPDVRILATSREALEIQGERVHRLEGLPAPQTEELGLEQSEALGAVQLFVERAAACSAGFRLTPANLQPVGEICRQLDGMPLAIELAAARVDALGAEGVAARLEQMFEVLTRGRRTALPRHRTLLALLDWSYGLLNDVEQTVLRRLSVFRSAFSLDLAARLCADERLSPSAIVEAVLSLVAKSLIAVGRRGDALQYRLLYTTRGYAEDRLAASGEHERWQRCHAQALTEVLEAAQTETCSPWAGEFARRIEDLHAALDWTLTPAADLDTCTKLVTVAYLYVWRGGAVRNLHAPMEVLLEKLRTVSPPQPQLELRLRTGLTFLAPSFDARYTSEQLAGRAMELVSEVGNAGDRIELHYGLFLDALRRANYPASVAHTHCIAQLCTGPYEHLRVALADRLLALTLGNMAEYERTFELAEGVLNHRPAVPIHPRFGTMVPLEMSMGALQARIRWLQGRAEEAQARCDRIMPLVMTAPPLATCQFVGLIAMPIVLWRGDLQVASELQQILHDTAERSFNPHWIGWARMMGRALQVQLSGVASTWGDAVELPDVPSAQYDMEVDMLPTLVPQWLTPRALQRAEANAAPWCAPEVLRAAAEQRMASGRPGDWPAADALLQRARELASAQGARAWQLRIACSQARLELARGRAEQGHAQLAEVLAQMTEGLADADPRQAQQLLAQLSQAMDAVRTDGGFEGGDSRDFTGRDVADSSTSRHSTGPRRGRP